MKRTILVPVQSDGSIELLDILRAFTFNQLEYLITLLEKDPLFDKKDENSQLIEDIRDIIADKKLESQIDKVKTMTPEFKAMVVGVLEQILGYGSNSKMKK